MRAVSLFSGVGGFERGFERAGIETVLQAERDPWCLEVLGRHWPETERVTDVRAVGADSARLAQCASDDGPRRDQPSGARGWATGRPIAHADGRVRAGGIDLVYGGFPCQDLSVAGKRAGLGGERSGEWFEFHRVLRELRPRWAVVENVPGLLSSNEGRDFGVILDGLDELGFAVAWAVLDAQHFGIPQRRRRVFVVAGPSRRSVEQVLSLCESCGGNPETGRAAGEGVAATLGGGSTDSQRGFRDDLDTSTYVVARPLAIRGRVGGANAEMGGEVGNALRAGDGGQSRSQLIHTYNASDYKSGQFEADDVARPLTGTADRTRGAPIAIRTAQTGSNGWGVGTDEQAYTLDGAQGRAIYPGLSVRDAKGPSSNADQAPPLVTASGVRRLTPLECERLMGWPDDHTRWTAEGKEISDSHRYRMCGNGVVSTVAEWIGHRLVAVDRALEGVRWGRAHPEEAGKEQ